MRIVSLLPSLTELVCALGRGDELVGVTHECDYPPGVELIPHLTRSNIPPDASGATIDALVAERRGSLYELDATTLADLRPDLILTQEQCDVCAVDELTVRRVAANLPNSIAVESVNPTDLESLFAMFRRVGVLLDARAAAEDLIDRFARTEEEIARRIEGEPIPRILVLEWLDPPFSSGHWNPEIIALAGGREAVGRAGERSRRIDWSEVAAADPTAILISACGFSVDRTEVELTALADHPDWRGLRAVRDGRVAITDGSAYFSRPGPRLEASIRVAATFLHPDLCGDMAPADSLRAVPAGSTRPAPSSIATDDLRRQ